MFCFPPCDLFLRQALPAEAKSPWQLHTDLTTRKDPSPNPAQTQDGLPLARPGHTSLKPVGRSDPLKNQDGDEVGRWEGREGGSRKVHVLVAKEGGRAQAGTCLPGPH